MRFLLGAGAEVEQRSTSGQAALHLAVLSANIPIVQLLLEHGADFEVTLPATCTTSRRGGVQDVPQH